MKIRQMKKTRENNVLRTAEFKAFETRKNHHTYFDMTVLSKGFLQLAPLYHRFIPTVWLNNRIWESSDENSR